MSGAGVLNLMGGAPLSEKLVQIKVTDPQIRDRVRRHNNEQQIHLNTGAVGEIRAKSFTSSHLETVRFAASWLEQLL